VNTRPRTFKLHWWRAKNCWSVVLSDRCLHAKRVVVRVPVVALLQQGSPRAYITGKGFIHQTGSDNIVIEGRPE